MYRLLRILAVAATAGMFVVLVMGATVTNTGSEHGCGRSWPLCHGQLIPQFAVSTAIEFTHRAVVGVESVLIIALAAGAIYLCRRKDIILLSCVMVAFLFLQAGLGAWAVMYPQLAVVLALHFGVSLIAFASVLLVTAAIFEWDGAERLRSVAVPRSFTRYLYGLTAYTYIVVYLGALVRHVDADEACAGWPLCNGAVVPALAGHVLVAFTHRVAAGLLVLGVVGLAVWARQLRRTRPDLARGSAVACGLVVLQALSGAVVAFTEVDLFSALAHAALVGLFFGTLCYLCLHVVPVPRRALASGVVRSVPHPTTAG
jgi:cytochrome c oxidase assembly protein subunit 15